MFSLCNPSITFHPAPPTTFTIMPEYALCSIRCGCECECVRECTRVLFFFNSFMLYVVKYYVNKPEVGSKVFPLTVCSFASITLHGMCVCVCVCMCKLSSLLPQLQITLPVRSPTGKGRAQTSITLPNTYVLWLKHRHANLHPPPQLVCIAPLVVSQPAISHVKCVPCTFKSLPHYTPCKPGDLHPFMDTLYRTALTMRCSLLISQMGEN